MPMLQQRSRLRQLCSLLAATRTLCASTLDGMCCRLILTPPLNCTRVLPGTEINSTRGKKWRKYSIYTWSTLIADWKPFWGPWKLTSHQQQLWKLAKHLPLCTSLWSRNIPISLKFRCSQLTINRWRLPISIMDENWLKRFKQLLMDS